MPKCSRRRAVGESGCVVGGGDHLDVADSRHHQGGQRVVDHRLVVDRHQLLAHAHRDRVQPRPRSTGKDDPPHQPARSCSRQLGGGQRRREVGVAEHRGDVVVHDAERRRLSVFLLRDDDTIADIHPARDGRRGRQGADPLAQGGMALPCSVRVAEFDVVTGNLSQGVKVPLVERVMPGKDGRDLRSRHSRENTPLRTACVRAMRPRPSVSPKTSISPSATSRLRTIASSRSSAVPRNATSPLPCS